MFIGASQGFFARTGRDYLQPLYLALQAIGSEIDQAGVVIHYQGSRTQRLFLSNLSVFPRRI
jgi:hypothetical protein